MPLCPGNNTGQPEKGSPPMGKPKKVCVIGSGNWGTAIARIVGGNASRRDGLFNKVVMYVYEEMVGDKKLTEIINETHENVKYLPGYKIPPNVIAVPDLIAATKDADVLIFVIPHQYVRSICATLLGKIKPTACGLSLIKGFDRSDDGGIELVSRVIQKLLRIQVSVLMGANLANEVAAEQFTEATIGCQNKQLATLWYDIMGTDNFKVSVTEDVSAVEVYSGLKNIIAFGSGMVDGLDLGDNTKAAMIRLGLLEMIKFVDVFYPGSRLSTVFESCGIADLLTTCYGGRNRRIAEQFVKTGKTISQLEKDILNGQKLQGPITAEEVNIMLKQREMEKRFPVMTTIHRVCKGQMKPIQLIDALRAIPDQPLDLLNTSF